MLSQLKINNFAIVEKLDLNLNGGFNVITGETGAGKSIAIDALNIALGAKASANVINNNSQKAQISAVFDIGSNLLAQNWLNHAELNDSDNPNQVILRRILDRNKGSKTFINDHPISLTKLRELGMLLVQINSQHSAKELLKPSRQLKLLDNFALNSTLLKQMSDSYQNWQKLKQQLAESIELEQKSNAEKKLLEYQISELDELNLAKNEYQQLSDEQKKMANTELLQNKSQQALDMLTEGEHSDDIERSLHHVMRLLDELSDFDENFKQISQNINEALILVQESAVDINHFLQDIQSDPALLESINIRLDKIISLSRKHMINPEELYIYQQQLRQKLDNFAQISSMQQQLQQQLDKAAKECEVIAEKLHNNRVLAAKRLELLIIEKNQALGLEKATVKLDLEYNLAKISAFGADNINFLFCANIGQALQPLAEVASGGELSRMCLAIETICLDQNEIGTVIFDEIDSGISGKTADVVGQMLQQIGTKSQVICVTHLAQVACYGDNHFMVSKQHLSDKTITNIEQLDNENRILAIANLVGGGEITQKTKDNAIEMLDAAKCFKSNSFKPKNIKQNNQ